ncbi:MAG: bifunctional enoyl-CoA hydratase/phosphate acetyltransferase [Bacteroidales bacterium]|nr:bifunctional enoyl-CoA hydratase/phosphate acetyltransferase [Bacteroidales bacterium]
MKTLNEILEKVKQLPNKRLIAANGVDEHTIEAIYEAKKMGLIDATLVGDSDIINQTCKKLNIDVNNFEVIDIKDEQKAALEAVKIIYEGKGDLLMKGLIGTDKYMRAILNKEYGLVPPKGLLTHITVIETPNYHKLLTVSDVAILPLPDLKQKIAITNLLIKTAKRLEIETPKVAIITAAELVTEAMPSTIDAAIISKMGDRGQIKGGLIEGPLSLDLSIDPESVKIKGMKSEVAGDADCLLFPNIEAGNVFYKTNTKLADAELGAFVAGAKVPCILSSRGDSAKTKMYSIALSALMA